MLGPAAPSTPTRHDVLIAAAVTALAVLEAVVSPVTGVETSVRLAGAIAVGVPLVLRRTVPLGVLLVTFTAVVALSAIGVPPDAGLTPVPTVALVAWSVAVHPASAGRAIAGGVLALGGVTAIELATGDMSAGGLVFGALIVAAPWAAGFALRRRAEESDQHRTLAHEAQRRREEAVRAAVTDERERIARELHDVVAHALSIITIQAGAAEQQLRRDVQAASDSLRAVQDTSREALLEMRRMLQLLRPMDATAARSPQPGLDAVAELVEASSRSGVPVELRWHGEGDRQVAPGLGLAAYRIVQEALTNVRKHAGPVPTTVTVICDADALRLEVVNDAGAGTGLDRADPAPGHGLIGMRERVALYDGTLSAAATATGGYAVHATLARR